MIEVTWRKSSASKNDRDLISEGIFRRLGRFARNTHQVISDNSAKIYQADFDCKIEKASAELVYKESFTNRTNGIYLGTMRFYFEDAARTKVRRVGWKPQGKGKFDFDCAKARSISDDEARALIQLRLDSPSVRSDKKVQKSVRVRLGQPKFRANLIVAHEGRCVISDCTLLPLLEAAHIKPYAMRGKYSIENGLLLRSDLHMLFDQNLLCINPKTRKVEVSRQVSDVYYRNFHGREVKAISDRSLSLLSQRHKKFLKD